MNQIEARIYLERLGQRSDQPLHEFEKEFTNRLRMFKEVNIGITKKELILLYIVSRSINLRQQSSEILQNEK